MLNQRVQMDVEGGLKDFDLGTDLLGDQDPEQGDTVDLTGIDAAVADDTAAKLRKKLGVPELDPDALPSSTIQKYLMPAPFLKPLKTMFPKLHWG